MYQVTACSSSTCTSTKHEYIPEERAQGTGILDRQAVLCYRGRSAFYARTAPEYLIFLQTSSLLSFAAVFLSRCVVRTAARGFWAKLKFFGEVEGAQHHLGFLFLMYRMPV